MQLQIRPAKVGDVRAIRALVEPLSRDRVLLNKDAVTYYESLQQFLVAELVPEPDADGPAER